MTDYYNWPSDVPYSPLVGTWSSQSQTNDIEAPADVGEGDVRSRSTASSEVLSFSLMMTKLQLQSLRNFYKTVRGRVYLFWFKHQETDEMKLCRFYNPIQTQDVAPDYFRVTVSLITKAE